MIKKTKPLVRQYNKVDIYLDDIKNIFDLIKEKESRVSIETDKYKYQEWETFIANTSRTATLNISTYNFDLLVSLSFGKYVTILNLEFSQDHDKAIVVFTKIDEILTPLQRRNVIDFSPGKINFFRKDQKITFWEKNMDNVKSSIISKLIVNILMFIFGFAAQYLYTLFT